MVVINIRAILTDSTIGINAFISFATLNSIGGKMGQLFKGKGNRIRAERAMIDL